MAVFAGLRFVDPAGVAEDSGIFLVGEIEGDEGVERVDVG